MQVELFVLGLLVGAQRAGYRVDQLGDRTLGGFELVDLVLGVQQKIADRSSRMDLRENKDGSVDIYCGPRPPAGFEKNWIPTVPRKNWFAYFRFYQPTEAYFDRSWPLPDFEQL